MSNIKFGTDGWRAIIADDYTVANVARVATATANWLKQRHQNPSIVIGYDCRFGGEMFAQATARVHCEAGVKVKMAKGFVSTPMVSLGANRLNCPFGIVITASHNPPSYNGYKIKAEFGGPASPAVIAEVEELIPEQAALPSKSIEDFEQEGMIDYVDLETMYIDHVKNSFDLEAINNSGLVLAYDAMYGAGQNVVKQLLNNVVLLHCDDNPGFMGQAPEPIDRNLQELSKLITNSSDIDAGLATDGDADRIGMYNGEGEFIDAHHLILLMIHYFKNYKEMDGKVVVAFSVTHRVKKLCEHYGLDYEITKIGFKYVCEHMVKEDVLVGGEESGGIAMKGHIPERDGIWGGLVLLEFMAKSGKSLDELIAEVYEVVGPFKYNRNDLHITEKLKTSIIEDCRAGKFSAFGAYQVEEVETIDGFKFHLGNERTLMIRPSGTEPVLRVYAEAENMDTVTDILNAAKATLLP